MTNYDYTYFEIQKRRRLPLILQIAFLAIGTLLIIAFAFLFNNESQTTSAILFSPIERNEKQIKKDYSYNLLWGDPKTIVYKETQGATQTLKILTPSTNLSKSIVSGKRIGFIGFLTDDALLFLEDKEGLGRFTISKYNTLKNEVIPFLAFDAFSQIPEGELDRLVSLSPDKTRLSITHQSGIVIYVIRNEKETTILENKPKYTYRKPTWISDKLLLVYQIKSTEETLLIVSVEGNLQAVLPASFVDLSPSYKNGSLGLPLVGVTATGLHLIDIKKTTLLREATANTQYSQPVWLLENTIISFANVSSVPIVLKTDSQGKKVVTLAEFPNDRLLSNLITDPARQNIYFLTTQKGSLNINVNFYKMGLKEDKPISFYSIAKNL